MDENDEFDFDFNELGTREQLDMLNDVIPESLSDKYGTEKKKYIEHVFIYMSNILNRNGESIGFGAFAKKDHNDGAIIGIYDGDIISLDEIKENNIDTTYGVNITNTNFCINSTSPYSCFARYINDGMSEEINNCTWQKVGKYTMKIKATRHISAGDELLISYGSYWAEFDRFELLSDENRLLAYNDEVHEMKDWIDQNYILRDDVFHRIHYIDD